MTELKSKTIFFKGNNNIVITPLFDNIKDNFTYEFLIKPSESIDIVNESKFGFSGASGQSYFIVPGQGKRSYFAGTGVSIGTNGLVVSEQSKNHFPALLVYEGPIVDWTYISIVFRKKRPILFINGIFVKGGRKSTKKHVFPSGIFGGYELNNLFFCGEVKDFKLWDHIRTPNQISQNMNKIVSQDVEKGLLLTANSIEWHKNLSPLLLKEEVDNYYQPSVSIVIPTLNAMKEYDFEALICTLLNQRGFKNIEVIVVDSGSTDTTVKKVKDYELKLIEIPNEQFTHAYARNLGASYATHEYILFMTQDAFPTSENWLFTLYNELEKHGGAAVSCTEFPREDADLYYRICSWAHRRFLEVEENSTKICSLPKDTNYINLRRNASLSNVSCLVRKSIFDKYKFKLDYGEDLEFGLKLLKNNYSIAITDKISVIHSNKKDDFYYLKRGFIDTLYLLEVFPEINHRQYSRVEDICKDAIFSYFKIISLLNKLTEMASSPIKVDTFIELLNNFEQMNSTSVDKIVNTNLSEEFQSFLATLFLRSENVKHYSPPYDSILFQVSSFFHLTIDYLKDNYEVIDKEVIEDFKLCVYKILANKIGIMFATYYFNNKHHIADDLREMINHIKVGV